MFSRILVPLDGSQRAEQALPVAARISQATHGAVILVQILSSVAYVGAEYMPPIDTIGLQLREAEEYLRSLTRSADLQGIPSSVKAQEGALVADDILKLVAHEHADLLILCTHGRTGLVRWAFGSVAERLIHHACIPVLVLRTDGLSPTLVQHEPNQPIQVLVPLDGSVLAEAALVPAAYLATALAAPSRAILHLLEVLDLTYIGTEQGGRVPMDRKSRQAVREGAKQYLSGLATRLAEGDLGTPGLQVIWSVLEDVDAAAAIIDVAENGHDRVDEEAGRTTTPSDLICMATHGRSGLQRWVLGSITERVLQSAKLPVLVVRPHGLAAKALGMGKPNAAGLSG